MGEATYLTTHIGGTARVLPSVLVTLCEAADRQSPSLVSDAGSLVAVFARSLHGDQGTPQGSRGSCLRLTGDGLSGPEDVEDDQGLRFIVHAERQEAVVTELGLAELRLTVARLYRPGVPWLVTELAEGPPG